MEYRLVKATARFQMLAAVLRTNSRFVCRHRPDIDPESTIAVCGFPCDTWSHCNDTGRVQQSSVLCRRKSEAVVVFCKLRVVFLQPIIILLPLHGSFSDYPKNPEGFQHAGPPEVLTVQAPEVTDAKMPLDLPSKSSYISLSFQPQAIHLLRTDPGSTINVVLLP